jgi:hypothetical protein
MAQRPLQLLGQLPLDGGRRGGPQQAGHHPGIGPQGRNLTVVPVPRASRVHLQGPDRAPGPAPPAHSRPPATGPPPAPGQPRPSGARPAHPAPPPGAARARRPCRARPPAPPGRPGPARRASEALAQVSSSSLPTSMSPAPSASTGAWPPPPPAGGPREGPRLAPGWSGCRCFCQGGRFDTHPPHPPSPADPFAGGTEARGVRGARPEATRQRRG